LNENIDQLGLTHIYSVFHPATAQNTFFSAAHGTFSKTDHILGHKASLNNDHNAIKLGLYNKRNKKVSGI
jgi:hypothetical protein